MLWLLLLQVLASCLWLGHSEVVTSFETSCPQFFYRNTPPNNTQISQNTTMICQRYDNRYRFATLYNKTSRIPVYSAYVYQPGSCNRSYTWLVEPQLINLTYSKEMSLVSFVKKEYNISSEKIRESQAVTQDYNNVTGLDRGHLNPCGHQSDDDNTRATFTLTNAVPQNSSLNKGAWRTYEQQTMKNKTQGCTTTYVITGAVPGNSSISNGRVNKPSHIWSAACCQTSTSMKAWAAIAQNNKNQVQLLSVKELEGNLTRLYGRGQISLFHSDCPRK